jgi:hypothetical protein
MKLTQPTPYREATEKLGGRSVVGSQLKSAGWQRVPIALRERAFFSATVENARWLQTARDGIGDFLSGSREEVRLEDGTTTNALRTGSRAEFVARMRQLAIDLGMGPLDEEPTIGPDGELTKPRDKTGTIEDIRSEARLRLIFDTQTQAAHDFGYWKQGMDPAVLAEFPAQRFIREREVKVKRPPHMLNEGVVKRKDDLPFWLAMNSPSFGGFGVPWGPWGFWSGMGVEDVDRDEAERLGLVQPGEQLAPVEADFNDHLKASVRGLDRDLIAWLKMQFGSQVKFDKGAVWWTGDRVGKRLAVDPKPKAPPTPPPPARLPGEWPTRLEDVEAVRPLGGSTGAQLVRDKVTGDLYVLKRGATPEHLREEFAADEFYRGAGVPVPEARLYEGDRPVKLARFVEGKTLGEYLKTASPQQRDAVYARIQDAFAIDAWAGNWDVAGMGLDNILVDAGGVPWRIDNGGSFRFRAQGKPKTDAEWNQYPSELWSLRDQVKNPQTARVFAGLTIFDIARQVQRLDSGRIPAVVPPEVSRTLAARLEQLRSVADKALEFERTKFRATHADEVVRHIVGMRAAGVFDEMAGALQQAHPGDVRPKDSQGRYFNHLRTTKAAATVDPSQAFFDDLLMAAKTVNGHHAKGDAQYNAPKLQKALGHKAALEKLLASGKPQEKQMAAYYLSVIEEIANAQGNLAAKVHLVTKFDLPPPKGQASDSVVARAAEYMRQNGADWRIVSEWANSQAGSSKSAESRALKYWWMSRLDGADASDFHEPPTEAVLNQIRGRHGEKYDPTWQIYHALVQEVLARTSFGGNDQARGVVRVFRTETTKGVVPFSKGKRGIYTRGVNESGSLFAPIFSGTRTVTAVPHSRLTGLYFLERQPGTGVTFFLGDSENEVTYIAWQLPALNLGASASATVDLDPGTDSTKWEIQ